VAAYNTAAYWFTSSTSFANPAVTVPRAATNTFSGIRTVDAPGFIIAQLLGASVATALFRWLVPHMRATERAEPAREPAHAAASALEQSRCYKVIEMT
jgi:glycerol uptake facilitator-like aquaporin